MKLIKNYDGLIWVLGGNLMIKKDNIDVIEELDKKSIRVILSSRFQFILENKEAVNFLTRLGFNEKGFKTYIEEHKRSKQ